MDNDKYINQLKESRKLLFVEYRLETFNNNWKELKGYKYCTPKNLAAAGFYNLSSSMFPDNVKCFACQKELSDWEKNDNPWDEHQKRGKKCPFIIFKMQKTPSIQDFLQLLYETKRNILYDFFGKQKDILKEKEKKLLKFTNTLKKTKK